MQKTKIAQPAVLFSQLLFYTPSISFASTTAVKSKRVLTMNEKANTPEVISRLLAGI